MPPKESLCGIAGAACSNNSGKKTYYVVRYVSLHTGREVFALGRASTPTVEGATRFDTVLDAAKNIIERQGRGATVEFTICRVEETTTPGEDTVSADLTPVEGAVYVLTSQKGNEFITPAAFDHLSGLYCWTHSPAAAQRFATVGAALQAVGTKPRGMQWIAGIARVIPGSPKVTRTITPVE